MPNSILNRRLQTSAPFNPANYGGGSLRAWYKADSLTLADAASVSTWADSSSVGNNMIAGTAPVFKQNIQNGKPGVLFTRASSQHLLCNGLAAVQNGTDLPFTVIVVAQAAAVNVTQEVFAWGNSGSNNQFSNLEYGSAGAVGILRRDDTAATSATANSAGSQMVAATTYVQSFSFTGTTGVTRQNGVQVASGAVNVGLTTMTRASIGSWPRSAPANFFGGYVFECIVYTTALSTGEVSSIERAMSVKWGVQF